MTIRPLNMHFEWFLFLAWDHQSSNRSFLKIFSKDRQVFLRIFFRRISDLKNQYFFKNIFTRGRCFAEYFSKHLPFFSRTNWFSKIQTWYFWKLFFSGLLGFHTWIFNIFLPNTLSFPSGYFTISWVVDWVYAWRTIRPPNVNVT